MKYADGRSVLLGDKVDLGAGVTGVVVAVIDSNEFASGYKPEEWAYLLVGALVESEEAGLTHYKMCDDDFVLIERASNEGGAGDP